jgi:hypothetical protein
MLKSITGTNAGMIWHHLDKNGECAVNKLAKQLGMNNQQFFMALGWLTRENKVAFYEKEEITYVFLHY